MARWYSPIDGQYHDTDNAPPGDQGAVGSTPPTGWTSSNGSTIGSDERRDNTPPPPPPQPVQQPAPAPAPQQPSGQQPAATTGDAVAIDGQRFSQQPTSVQDLFKRQWGSAAADHWMAEHNQAVLNGHNDVSQGGTQTVVSGGGGTAGGGGTVTTGSTGGSGGQLTGQGALAQAQAFVQQHPTTVLAALGVLYLTRGGRRR